MMRVSAVALFAPIRRAARCSEGPDRIAVGAIFLRAESLPPTFHVLADALQ
jgi:hypothetical protein